MFAEELVERIAAADRQCRFLVRWWVDRLCENEGNRRENQVRWRLDIDLCAFYRGQDGFLGRWCNRRRHVQRGYQSQAGERDAEADDEPLQGFGFLRLLLYGWLVIVQQWTDRTMQVCDPIMKNVVTLPLRFVNVKENCYKSER